MFLTRPFTAAAAGWTSRPPMRDNSCARASRSCGDSFFYSIFILVHLQFKKYSYLKSRFFIVLFFPYLWSWLRVYDRLTHFPHWRQCQFTALPFSVTIYNNNQNCFCLKLAMEPKPRVFAFPAA